MRKLITTDDLFAINSGLRAAMVLGVISQKIRTMKVNPKVATAIA